MTACKYVYVMCDKKKYYSKYMSYSPEAFF